MKFVREASATTGTVVEQRPSSGENGTMYTTVFEFVDAAGQTRRVDSAWSSSPPAYAVGERVDVLYPAANPANACVRSFTSLWLGPTIVGGLAFVPLLIGTALIWLIPFTIRRVWPRPAAV